METSVSAVRRLGYGFVVNAENAERQWRQQAPILMLKPLAECGERGERRKAMETGPYRLVGAASPDP